MAHIKPICTEADYEQGLTRIDELMGSEYGSPEGDELDVLVTLVESWEDEHYPMGYPEPHEAIRFRMEQAGLRPRDLIPIIGSRSRRFRRCCPASAPLPCPWPGRCTNILGFRPTYCSGNRERSSLKGGPAAALHRTSDDWFYASL